MHKWNQSSWVSGIRWFAAVTILLSAAVALGNKDSKCRTKEGEAEDCAGSAPGAEDYNTTVVGKRDSKRDSSMISTEAAPSSLVGGINDGDSRGTGEERQKGHSSPSGSRQANSSATAAPLVRLEGFSPTESAMVQKAVDWILAHHPTLLPARELTIRKVEYQEFGRTTAWLGDMELAAAIFNGSSPDSMLVNTISHEFFHARQDASGRTLSGFYEKVLKDSAEHDFIDRAGKAVQDEFDGSTEQARRTLGFLPNGEPVLRPTPELRAIGAEDETLPPWSLVRKTFLKATAK